MSVGRVAIFVQPGTCQLAFSDAPCGDPAVSYWSGACVHEHVTPDIGICAAHQDRALRPWICTLCKEGADPHRCEVRLIREAP